MHKPNTNGTTNSSLRRKASQPLCRGYVNRQNSQPVSNGAYANGHQRQNGHCNTRFTFIAKQARPPPYGGFSTTHTQNNDSYGVIELSNRFSQSSLSSGDGSVNSSRRNSAHSIHRNGNSNGAGGRRNSQPVNGINMNGNGCLHK